MGIFHVLSQVTNKRFSESLHNGAISSLYARGGNTYTFKILKDKKRCVINAL